ncbi:MAG: hypothetical protein FJW29_04350 [Acidobacteria bacterium]|nr:hypothetical protein [Acidobacteriota bacterium]
MNRRESVRALGLLLAGSAVGAQAQPSTTAPSATDRIRINGWALNMSNINTGANQGIRIDITGWSNPSQREFLVRSFLEKQQEGLLTALQQQPEIGRFTFPGYMGPDPDNIYRLGTDIRYAMNHPLPDGDRRIVIITLRVLGCREVLNQPRTGDKFTLLEMRFDAKGKGEGRMAWATRIRMDNRTNTIDLENYTSEPVRLLNLQLDVLK